MGGTFRYFVWFITMLPLLCLFGAPYWAAVLGAVICGHLGDIAGQRD